MTDDEMMNSVEVISEICKAHTANELTEIQAIRAIAGIIGQDDIKKGNTISIITNLCEAYDKRHITKEAALFGIMGRLRAVENLEEILNSDE